MSSGQGRPALINSGCRSNSTFRIARKRYRAALDAARIWFTSSIALVMLCFAARSHATELVPPAQPLHEPITVRAQYGTQWREGEYEVWMLHGECELHQGEITARCRDAVLWVARAEPGSNQPSQLIAYLESDVGLWSARRSRFQERTSSQMEMDLGKSWLGRFQTAGMIEISALEPLPSSGDRPPIYGRGVEALGWTHAGGVQEAQFVEPLPPTNTVETVPSARHVQIGSRGSVGSQVQSYPGTTPDETIIVVTGGVRVIVSGIQGVGDIRGFPIENSGVVTIEADRVVAWTTALADLQLGGGTASASQGRWEVYLEGNIVFKEGDRVVYADRMYYHVNENRGTILNAELLTPIPEYEGLLRLKADVIQQVDSQHFLAYGAAATSSRMGVPRYWFQSENVTFRDEQRPRFDPFSGRAIFDPLTNEQAVDHSVLVTSRNNFTYVGGVPVLYWPVLTTDATKPTYYVDRVRLKNDNVFGTQVLVDWDTFQVFGLTPWEGTKWTFATDYLSDRGPGLGTNLNYDRTSLWNLPGPVHGMFDAWGMKEEGLDNLGFDRRALFPEEEFRGRVLWQHRHYLPNGYQLSAEFGLISDRNFLEQYYEHEWDQEKDQITGLELKRYVENSSWSITADARLNDFFTQTEHLPRFDHFLIGQPILNTLTWHAHSLAGYDHLRPAVPPSPINPSEVATFVPMPWEADREGLRVSTRHEVDWPVQLGALKFVPYVLGEAAHWGEDLAGSEVTRYYGQAGVRASLPMWRADPMVQNTLFNLNGMAHKVTFDFDLFYADAEEDLTDLPLYDQVDDDATEHFRRRYLSTIQGTPSTVLYDERFYALRTGMQSSVTAQSMEIADDLAIAKFGIRQRWQTKRGLPGQERIIDWIVLDVEGCFFPNADENNFGQKWGMFDYDFRWHVGDRLTLLSDGYADFFGQGLRVFTFGGIITRPERGSLYLGFRDIEGPISSNLLVGSVSYRMSEKWILTAGASFDFGQAGNIGQTLQLTRIGESALIRLGFNQDVSRNNVGVNFTIEPRFLASSKLGRVGGVQVPPAGAYGLE